ncbi:MAG: GntR family transcriptional regulator [Burkholderiales bacterium]|nr:GntR family transcriptional regulator [Burkholderiales bacterium]
MRALGTAPHLVEQVSQALLDEITSGALAPGARLIQEQIAQALGVSRQPVQQALLLLRNQGVLRDAPGRGLIVAPLDSGHVRHVYALRAVLEGLAARDAAKARHERAPRQGAALLDAGRRAVASGSLARMIAADTRFHEFLYGLSGSPLIGPALATHLTYTQRAMGEVLVQDTAQRTAVWDQHAQMLDAICAGDGDGAEQLAREHIEEASALLLAGLEAGIRTRTPPAG